jgi:hypothetical protein
VVPPGPPGPYASVIAPVFPPILREFERKQFTLLWRASRDGFGGRAFHARCDGHANTLTLIEDTEGNSFGGFTPVKWESLDSRGGAADCTKADPSRRSFIFSLKNPHKVGMKKFRLLEGKKKVPAIECIGPETVELFTFQSIDTHTLPIGLAK